MISDGAFNDLNILHLDMDAFYASVEEVDDPSLKGKPVIVGGLSNHGVVTTANYEARKYGVHSAMPAFKAKELCPYGIYLKPRMNRYRQVSDDIFKILRQFTNSIEKLSVDEAYLDISQVKANRLDIIKEIKDKVYRNVGITMSIGLSYNKFLAKIASDWNKPNGLKIIDSSMVPEILYNLNINKVYGIGPKSSEKLNNIGVFTVRDLIRLDEEFLIDLFGKSGREIYYRIRGIDSRAVEIGRERKSLGVERTFNKSTLNREKLENYLREYTKKLCEDLKSKGLKARTVNIKVKDDEFKTQTRSKTLSTYIEDFDDIYKIGLELLKEVKLDRSIRLLGISVSNLISINLEQLSLFE